MAVLSSAPTSSIFSDVLEAPIVTLVGGFGQLVRDARGLLRLLAAEARASARVDGHGADDREHAHLIANGVGVGRGGDLAAHPVDDLGHRESCRSTTSIWITLRLSERNRVDRLLDVGGSFGLHRERAADRPGARRAAG